MPKRRGSKKSKSKTTSSSIQKKTQKKKSTIQKKSVQKNTKQKKTAQKKTVQKNTRQKKTAQNNIEKERERFRWTLDQDEFISELYGTSVGDNWDAILQKMHEAGESRKWDLELLNDKRKIKTRIDKLKLIFLKEKRQYKVEEFHPKASLSQEENENLRKALASENTRNQKLWDSIRVNLMKGKEREEELMSTERTETESEIREKNRKNGMRRREVRQQRIGTKATHAGAEKRFRHFVEFALTKCLAELCGETREDLIQQFNEYEKEVKAKETEDVSELLGEKTPENQVGETNTQGQEEEEVMSAETEDNADASREEDESVEGTTLQSAMLLDVAPVCSSSNWLEKILDQNDEETIDDVTVATLKKRLSEKRLSIAGNKATLWKRWKEVLEKEEAAEETEEEETEEDQEEEVPLSRLPGQEVVERLRRATMSESLELMEKEKRRNKKKKH